LESPWFRLGMGFSANSPGGTEDTLFVAGSSNGPGLGRLNPSNNTLQRVGKFSGALLSVKRSDDIWLYGRPLNDETANALHFDGCSFEKHTLPEEVRDAVKIPGAGRWLVSTQGVVKVQDGPPDPPDGLFVPLKDEGSASNVIVGGAGDDAWWLTHHWQGREWWATDLPNACGVHGTGPNDVWFGGRNGVITHKTSGSSEAFQTESRDLCAVFALAPDDVWFGAELQPILVHWDGSTSSKVLLTHLEPDPQGIRLILGRSANDVWVVGFGAPAHWNGVEWTNVSTGPTEFRLSDAEFDPDGNLWVSSHTGHLPVRDMGLGTNDPVPLSSAPTCP